MATSIERIPADVPIVVSQGATLEWTTTITVDDVAQDLTVSGNVVTVVVENTTNQTNQISISSAGVSPQITLNASGQAAVTITAAQTTALSPGTYWYALRWTKPSGAVIPLHAGPFTVTNPYT